MCVFCNPANIRELLIWETKRSYVLVNRFPITSLGHFLIISKDHAKSMNELSDEAYNDLFINLRKLVALIEKNIAPQGYNVIINKEEIAGQSVPHFHIHVILRQDGDGIENFKKSGNRPEITSAKVGAIRKMLESDFTA